MRPNIIATVLVIVIAGLPAAHAAPGFLVNYAGSLDLGKDQAAPFENCDRIGSCQDLAGISLVDLDVSDEIGGVPSGHSIRYELKDSGKAGYHVVAYRMCQYTASGTLIRCDQDSSAAYWLMGSVNRQTATIRIILMSGADRDFKLKVWSAVGNF